MEVRSLKKLLIDYLLMIIIISCIPTVMCWYIYRLWNTTAVLRVHKVTRWLNRNSPSGLQKSVLYSLPHLCGATVTPCIHSNLDSGPNMVLHQAGHVWLFGYKVTNSTLSLNPIAPREISDIIWYTFLTSLGCGCVGLWNNKSSRWNRDASVPKKTTPCKEQHYKLIYQEGDIMDPDCAMFTEERRKKLGCSPAR